MSLLLTKVAPPRNVIEDQVWFEAVNMTDPEDRFKIAAETEIVAKQLLLEKLGFYIHSVDGQFVLYDVDTDEPQSIVPGKTKEEAVDVVLKTARWKVCEPTFLLGGVTDLNEATDD